MRMRAAAGIPKEPAPVPVAVRRRRGVPRVPLWLPMAGQFRLSALHSPRLLLVMTSFCLAGIATASRNNTPFAENTSADMLKQERMREA